MPIRPDSAVSEISDRLEAAGYETWCVGGGVRDALLGESHLDWDLATSARPEQVKAVFGHRRTIPVGIDFGTVGVLDRHGRLHEVTTFRRDVSTDGRHAVVEFGSSLEDDLARRDFTINAIAFHPRSGEIRDPYGGQRDLEAGLVRAVGDAAERMREDRLRALRGIRFAARFGFRIDDATWQAIAASAPHLGRLSAERVRQELEKTVEQVRAPGAAFRMWLSSGAMRTLIPQLNAVTDEQLSACDGLPVPGPVRRPYRRIARISTLFLHLEPRAALEAAGRLRFSKVDAQTIFAVADRWSRVGRPLIGAVRSGVIADRDVRRWVAAIGRTHLPIVFRVFAAMDGVHLGSSSLSGATAAWRSLYRRAIRVAYGDPIEIHDLAIDGDDLRRAGIAPGPALGKILLALLDRVIADPAINTPACLTEEATRLYRELGGDTQSTGPR
jgi:tRNA nucleotidyltransferase (CCA-adding enzyme)